MPVTQNPCGTTVPDTLYNNTIYFTLYLPSGTEPMGGWPVMIWGHGGGSNKDGVYGLPAVAATMAANGIATIGITVVGHGYGSAGTITVTTASGSMTLPAGGRGFDQDGNGIIGTTEGYGPSVLSDHAIVSERDAIIQTDADLMQRVRVIHAGMEVDGDRRTDLDSSRVYYAGASLGGLCGTPFLAVEADVAVGALDVTGGARIDARRLGFTRAGDPPAGMSVATVLSTRYPSVINSPGITSLDGFSVIGRQPPPSRRRSRP